MVSRQQVDGRAAIVFDLLYATREAATDDPDADQRREERATAWQSLRKGIALRRIWEGIYEKGCRRVNAT